MKSKKMKIRKIKSKNHIKENRIKVEKKQKKLFEKWY